MQLIYRLKFCREIYMARACAPLLAELWGSHRVLSDVDDWVLVPVPVSSSRLMERRYNQARELALALSQLRGNLPVSEMLIRLGSSVKSQATLSAGQRMVHAKSVFRVHRDYESGRKMAPPHILLVDDLYTTGSTARICASLLKKLPGVKKVGVITLIHVQKH